LRMQVSYKIARRPRSAEGGPRVADKLVRVKRSYIFLVLHRQLGRTKLCDAKT